MSVQIYQVILKKHTQSDKIMQNVVVTGGTFFYLVTFDSRAPFVALPPSGGGGGPTVPIDRI